MEEKLTVTSGLRPFKIYFEDRNETVTIYFNPVDPKLPQKLLDIEKKIEKNFNINKRKEEGTINENDYLKVISELDNFVRSEIDYAFGNKISDKVFRFCSPLSIINGKYFFTIFLETLMPAIVKSIYEENESLNKHIGEYLNDKKTANQSNFAG